MGTMGTTETQTRSSEDHERYHLRVLGRLLIRRFGVRVPGGPPTNALVSALRFSARESHRIVVGANPGRMRLE